MFSKPQIFRMNLLVFLLLLLLSFLCFVQAQSAPGQNNSSGSNNFKPSLAIVVGVMTIMFSLTFILIMYAKFCHSPANILRNDHQPVNSLQIPNGFARQNSLYRGIDKTVIESIPFFKFSALKGSRRGLECAVCLSKYEDIEILRLLPKCKHAFHIGCIDEWLGKHSSCPLCRVEINPEDLATITYTDSMRHLSSQAELTEDPGVELYVQREDSNRSLYSRFNFRNSFRKSGNSVMKQEELPIQENEDNSKHKFNHKIIVSDMVLNKKRWSYLSSSDHVKLSAEKLGDVSRKRFSSFDAYTQENSTTWATEEGEISEIREEIMGRKTGFEPKVGGLNRTNSLLSSSNSLDHSRVLDQWYADRDKKSQQSNDKRESLNV